MCILRHLYGAAVRDDGVLHLAVPQLTLGQVLQQVVIDHLKQQHHDVT